MRTVIKGSIAGCVVGIWLGLTLSASGHSAANYYASTWDPAQRPTITWSFDDDFPTGSGWRARVRDGADRWNAVQPGNFVFSDIGDLVKSYNTDCSNWGLEQNIVFRTGMDGPGQKLAQTWICTKSSSETSTKTFILNIDADEDWYTGTGNPPPSSQCFTYCPDLWAVATHEFGHATGGWTTKSVYGHFDPQTNAALCGDAGATDYHTMCDEYHESTSGSPARGIRWRTLETHDIDTFEDAY